MKVNSVSTQQYLDNAQKAKTAQDKALQNISATRALSGTDSANLVIADSLLSQANTINQGISNANDAIGMLSIADSTLSNLTQSADRLNELSVAMNNPILSNRERSMIQSEASALTDSMKQSLSNASFNGKNVFGGNMEFQTGNGVESINLSQNAIRGGIESLNVNDQSSIESFISNVNSMRSDIGSAQNGILAGINSSLEQHVALMSSENNLQNNDMALNINNQKQNQTLLNAAILAQAHNTENLKNQMDRLLA